MAARDKRPISLINTNFILAVENHMSFLCILFLCMCVFVCAFDQYPWFVMIIDQDTL